MIDKTKELARRKRWRESHKEYIRAYRISHPEHPEQNRLRSKKYRENNKEKCRVYWREYRKTHRQKSYDKWERNREKKWNITNEQFLLLLKGAGNKCQICHTPFEQNKGFKYSAHIDHNHKTGKIRGVLCLHCNLGIGNLKDSPKILQNAIDYLGRTP